MSELEECGDDMWRTIKTQKEEWKGAGNERVYVRGKVVVKRSGCQKRIIR